MTLNSGSDRSIVEPAAAVPGLNDRMTAPTPGHMIFACTLALIVFAFVTWSFVSVIPTTLSGNGIIVRERQQVFAVQSAWGGTIAKINVEAGDEVEAGQILVDLARPELEEQIAVAKRDLIPLRYDFERDRRRLAAEVDAHNRATSNQLEALAEEQGALQAVLDELDGPSPPNGSAPTGQRNPGDDPSYSNDVYEQTRTALLETEIALARVQAEMIRFRTRATDQVEVWRRNVRDHRLKLGQLEARFENSRYVRAPVAGIVSEIRESIGQNVVSQDVLMTIASGGPGFEMLAFLDPEDAPRAKPGMQARVSPTTVNKGEYGTMRGDVAFISEAPVSTAQINALLRNIELSQEFTRSGQPYLCRIDLFETPDTRSGFMWWYGSGPPFPVRIGTLATVDIVVQEQPPIAFLVPALRELLGI